MSLTLQQAQVPKCPGAEIAQALLSPHPVDIECRIAGQVMPVGLRKCNGDYAECTIWKRHKIEIEANTTMAAARAFEDNRATQVIDGVERTVQNG